MTIETTQAGYFVRINYDKPLWILLSKVPGAQWDNTNNRWVIPLSREEKLKKIYDEYGVRNLALSRAVVGPIPPMPELSIDIPLKRPMYHYQGQGAAYCIPRAGTIIGDEMGLGKCTIAIATVIATNNFPCVIICSETLKNMWVEEWEKVAGRKSMILEDRNIENWHRYYENGLVDVFIVNFESVKRFFVAHIKKPHAWKVADVVYREKSKILKGFIVDESHRCRNEATQWTKFVAGLTFKKPLVLALSGTPVVNKTNDLIPQLQIINRLHEFGGKAFFIERYCKTDEYHAELNYLLNKLCYFQRLKRNVLPELPEKTRQRILCDITTRAEYREAADNLENYLTEWTNKTDAEVMRSLRGRVMVQIGICKLISARGKAREVFEHIDEVIAMGEKVVVFVHHKEISDLIIGRYPSALLIDGTKTTDERNNAVKAFQNDPKSNVISVSIKTGSEGLTLTAARYVAFWEFPWHAAGRNQCEDRVHRIGLKNGLTCSTFEGHDTIDGWLLDIIDSKGELASSITGNEDNIKDEIIDKLAASLFKRRSLAKTE